MIRQWIRLPSLPIMGVSVSLTLGNVSLNISLSSWEWGWSTDRGADGSYTVYTAGPVVLEVQNHGRSTAPHYGLTPPPTGLEALAATVAAGMSGEPESWQRCMCGAALLHGETACGMCHHVV